MGFVITVSRRFGTGASMIAEQLSKKLDIPVYDKAYIENELHENNYSDEAEVIRELAKEHLMLLCRPTLTLSKTDIPPKRRMFWKVRAMPRRLTCAVDIPFVSIPRSRIEPRVGW